jgi:hypothetical protein
MQHSFDGDHLHQQYVPAHVNNHKSFRHSIEVGSGDAISGGLSIRYDDKKGRGGGGGGPISQSEWLNASTNITSMRGGAGGNDNLRAHKTIEVRRREAEQAIQRTANIRKISK